MGSRAKSSALVWEIPVKLFKIQRILIWSSHDPNPEARWVHKALLKKNFEQQQLGAKPNTPTIAPLRAIQANEVTIGDLVFYEQIPDSSVALTGLGCFQVHHVEICTEQGKITGQINRAPDDMRGLSELRHTRVTALTPKAKDRLVVMRCQTLPLCVKAASYAVQWCADVIPFSAERLKKAEVTALVSASQHLQSFRESGMFRAIRYAARRNRRAFDGHDDLKVTQGMFCSQFVAACYQVAGLEDVVKPAANNVRVQDKRGKFSMDEIPSDFHSVIPQYKNYQASDQANDPDPNCRPGIVYWDFAKYGDIKTFPWEKAITAGMMVDSKLVLPAGLLTCLLADKEGWETVGVIKPEV